MLHQIGFVGFLICFGGSIEAIWRGRQRLFGCVAALFLGAGMLGTYVIKLDATTWLYDMSHISLIVGALTMLGMHVTTWIWNRRSSGQ